jgi:hypothetical protein
MQLPTLEATRQTIAQLEGELQTLQEQVQTLTVQRDSALKDAEQAHRSSEDKQGQEAVDEFRRATMLRKDAGELYTKIEETNARMVPIQRDLAVAQGQLQVLEEVIKQLQAQQQALGAGWKSMQEQIATQSQLARQIVGSDGAAAPAPSADDKLQMSGPSIAEKAAAINRIAGELKNDRGKAQEHLDEAAKQFQTAYTNADAVRKKLGELLSAIPDPNRADAKALKDAQEIVNPQFYQLREASARRLMGVLYAFEAASLMNRLNLKASVVPIIERAGATVPAILRPEGLDRELSQASKLAVASYEEADTMLENVREGTSPQETKNAAIVQQILTNYGWAQVLKAEGNAKEAQEKIDKAIALRDAAAEQKIYLPALPAELGSTPIAAPAAPAEGEAAPATTPAAPEPPADSPEEAAAREVITRYVDALIANDQDTIRSVVQVSPGEEAAFEQHLKMVADLAKLKETVTTKLGADAANSLAPLFNAMTAVKSLKITVSGDDATVEMPGAGTHKALVRADGEWKVFYGAPDNDAAQAQRAAQTKLAEALPQIIADVESGTIADAQELQAALVKAVTSA